MATRATSDSSSAETSLRLRFDAFELDEADARLTRDGEPIPLAPRPFAVLCALARTPRTLVTKNALLDSVWGHRFVSDSVLKTAVNALRAAMRDDPKQPRYIETVSRHGYRFIGKVIAAATPGESMPAPMIWAPELSGNPLPIIGRSDAMERLRAAWRRACSGKRQIVWIAGEPGVGKTTLIDYFAAEVGENYCAHGQCVEQSGAGEPYLPVLEALSALSHRDPSFGASIRAVAPTWLLQLPWLSSAEERVALRHELSGSGQPRMLREFGELLERYAHNQPLLLVTEDLHWSDLATVQLIDYVARRRASTRLLWLASYRLTEIVATDHPLKSLRHELRLHGLSDEIVLDAFSEKEVADYVAAKIPGLAAEETFVRALHARTDGLPLFVADVVTELMGHGENTIDGESSAFMRLASVAIPENLTGIIEQYMHRLTPVERALLEAASVCGIEFRLATVTEAMEGDVAALGALCLELVRRQRWLTDAPLERPSATRDARYTFRHALYREVLYNQIGPVGRAELHRKIAAALERERANGANITAAELASHLELAHQYIPAIRYYVEAAESTLLQFSPAQTMGLTKRALALLRIGAESDERATLELSLVTLQGAAAIQVHGISSIQVKQPFERAQSLLDDLPQHPLRGLVLHPLGLSLCLRGELDEAEALARRSEGLSTATGDRTVLLCACVTHGLVQHLRGRPRIARDWLERALDVGRDLDASASPAVFVADPGIIILGFLALDSLHLGWVEQGRDRIAAAYARARDLRVPPPQMAALWLDGLFEVRLGNPARVAEISEQLGVLADEHALAGAHAAHLWFRGWAQAQLGDPRAGFRLIREGYELSVRLGIRAWASETLGYAAEALANAGDWAVARQQLDEAMHCANAIGEREYLPQLLALDARIAYALGESKRAGESIRQAIAEARAQEAPWLEMIALSAACERQDASVRHREALRLILERVTGGRDTPPVARALALLEGLRGA
jgi:DNA-binding winged helix-turn-helix (wHTH) protein/tetratricopeptide (TPR) repeat protein